MERFDFIDYDEGKDPREPFFTEAFPCESCGKPCDERRPADWDESLLVGPCCYNVSEVETPEVPTCEALYEIMMSAETVGQMMTLRTAHKATCVTCGARKQAGSETRRERGERAA